MYRITGFLSLLEVAGLLGFINISRYQEGSPLRFLPLLIVFIAIVFIAYWKARSLSYMEIIYVSVVVTAIFISVVQFLGFTTVYPGLVKGVDFLSADNAVRILVAFFVGAAGHFLLITITRIARR